MITTLAATITLLAPPVPGTWGPSTLTPEALVRRVDSRMANLSKMTVKFRYSYEKKVVGFAYADCVGTVVSPTQFWLQVPQFDPQRKSAMEREVWLANGKQFGAAIAPERPTARPLSARPGVPSKPATIWFTNFSKVIFSGIGQPTHPLMNLLTDARRQGFKAVSQSRSLVFKGRNLVSNRLVLTKGPLRFELVFDGRGNLPVNVINTLGPDNTRWSAVTWDAMPPKPVKPQWAQFRTPARGPAQGRGQGPRRS